MVAGVYLITNKINDHKYVGGSINIENAIRTMQEDVIYG